MTPMHRHIVKRGEVLHRALRDHDVDVVVPGHDFGIPPPAEEGAVHQEGLDAEVVHCPQVGLDQVGEAVAAFVVGEFRGAEAPVVVSVEGGFVEVFVGPFGVDVGVGGGEVGFDTVEVGVGEGGREGEESEEDGLEGEAHLG